TQCPGTAGLNAGGPGSRLCPSSRLLHETEVPVAAPPGICREQLGGRGGQEELAAHPRGLGGDRAQVAEYDDTAQLPGLPGT
ncbi:MAG: hypothetical protein KY456_15625, partial [Chloroflexi bacterium]|nr:hypothetical protein [Chloroflexota bacterium]